MIVFSLYWVRLLGCLCANYVPEPISFTLGNWLLAIVQARHVSGSLRLAWYFRPEHTVFRTNVSCGTLEATFLTTFQKKYYHFPRTPKKSTRCSGLMWAAAPWKRLLWLYFKKSSKQLLFIQQEISAAFHKRLRKYSLKLIRYCRIKSYKIHLDDKISLEMTL